MGISKVQMNKSTAPNHLATFSFPHFHFLHPPQPLHLQTEGVLVDGA